MIDPRITGHLSEMATPYAVIGAVALAVHGAPRYSADIDLMVADTKVLDRNFWSNAPIFPTELRRGDWEDPLAGLAVFPIAPGAMPVEVVVGKGYAVRFALETAQENAQLGCPVVTPLGLALLKLEAGGTRDIHDLLALDEAQQALTGWSLTNAVEPHVDKLSRLAQGAWVRLKALLSPEIKSPVEDTPRSLPTAPPAKPKESPPMEEPGSREGSR